MIVYIIESGMDHEPGAVRGVTAVPERMMLYVEMIANPNSDSDWVEVWAHELDTENRRLVWRFDLPYYRRRLDAAYMERIANLRV